MANIQFRFFVCLAAIVLNVTACGGGGGSPPPPPAPDFAVSVAPASLSVVVGDTIGSTSVSVSPINGFTGTVSVAISGLPPGATTNPSSPLSVAANAPQSFTVSTIDSTPVHYGGTSPWTNGSVTAVPAATNPSGYAPELSAALVDANNQGLTVFVPGVYPYWSASWPAQSGGGGPTGNSTVYMIPSASFTIQPGQVIEGDVYLIPGDATSARAMVYALHQSLPDTSIVTPTVAIDAPTPNAAITGTAAPVGGWAFGKTAVSAVKIYVDGAFNGNATLGGARPDVVAAYPNLAPVNCGWTYSLDTTALANGAHSIAVHVTDMSNNEAVLVPVSVTVSN